MTEYEKYQLKWMIDHGYSIRDMITRIGNVAWCYNLRKIDISYFNISKVKNKNGMFCGCRALKHPDFISYK